jgi:hypothetical protein
MEILKYWHKEKASAQGPKGRTYDLTCWGGSSQSIDDAKEKAVKKLHRWIQSIGGGEKLAEYEYACGQLREELIEEIVGEQGDVIGAITRNRYGSLVLNSASVLIADVDVPEPGLIDWLMSLFGRKTKDKSFYLERVHKFSQDFPDYSMVVYETHSGLRVFITGDEFEPRSENAALILDLLQSDALYRKLCLSQQSYRARLTPKPWRCSLNDPPNRFPRETPDQQQAFNQWLEEYTRQSKAYTVCRPMAEMGPKKRTENAKRILKAHDAIAVNSAIKELA